MMNTVFQSSLLIWFNLFTEMLISPHVGMQPIISVWYGNVRIVYGSALLPAG